MSRVSRLRIRVMYRVSVSIITRVVVRGTKCKSVLLNTTEDYRRLQVTAIMTCQILQGTTRYRTGLQEEYRHFGPRTLRH